MGAVCFPPLKRSVEEVRDAAESFLVAFIGDELVGAASVWPDPEGVGINVASLVVSPHFQRQGIGTALLASILATHGKGEITVQTGVKNLPALAVYARAGFVEFRRWFVGREPLELVKLRRQPTSKPSGTKNEA